MTGIIVKYRVPRRPDQPKGEPVRRPLQDAQRAVRVVRSRNQEWGIDPQRIGMVGFSAGGHLALATVTRCAQGTYDPVDAIDTHALHLTPPFRPRRLRRRGRNGGVR
ncbi:MAG: alpha/beta hydrolase [Planctomycetota bacterium]|nr:alpha/beta hydrolase [Planctomycetota bacterium]